MCLKAIPRRLRAAVVEPDEEEKKIPEYIVSRMYDGTAGQLGIGGGPNAVGKMVARRPEGLGVAYENVRRRYVDMC
jgi:hypothetical protein